MRGQYESETFNQSVVKIITRIRIVRKFGDSIIKLISATQSSVWLVISKQRRPPAGLSDGCKQHAD